MTTFKQIDVLEAKVLIEKSDVTIVDIRNVADYNEAHIDNAKNIDDQNIETFLKEADKSKPLICYCYHGISSQNAAAFFIQNEFKDVYSIEGGYEKWRTI